MSKDAKVRRRPLPLHVPQGAASAPPLIRFFSRFILNSNFFGKPNVVFRQKRQIGGIPTGETRPLAEREAIRRGPKCGASGVNTQVRIEAEVFQGRTAALRGYCWGCHLRPLTEGPASSERVETRLDEGLGQPGLRPISEELTREGKAKTLRRR